MNQIRCTGLIAFMLYGSPSLLFFPRSPRNLLFAALAGIFLGKKTHYRAFIAKDGSAASSSSLYLIIRDPLIWSGIIIERIFRISGKNSQNILKRYNFVSAHTRKKKPEHSYSDFNRFLLEAYRDWSSLTNCVFFFRVSAEKLAIN
jgi:hypothetical protein